MEKLDFNIFSNLISKKITSNEFDLLLYMCRYQNEYGNVYGVYYKDAIEELSMSIQGFYNAMDGLKCKGIIAVTKGVNDFDVKIIGNNVRETENFRNGYISMSQPIVRDKVFYTYPVKAKMLVLFLMREEELRRKKAHEDQKFQNYLKKNFVKKFCALLEVQPRTLMYYVEVLNRYFKVYKKEKKYIFRFYDNIIRANVRKPINENKEFRTHQIDCAYRRNRIKDRKKTSGLMKKMSVYTKYIMRKDDFCLANVVKDTIEKYNITRRNKYKWKCAIRLGDIEERMQDVLNIIPELRINWGYIYS